MQLRPAGGVAGGELHRENLEYGMGHGTLPEGAPRRPWLRKVKHGVRHRQQLRWQSRERPCTRVCAEEWRAELASMI